MPNPLDGARLTGTPITRRTMRTTLLPGLERQASVMGLGCMGLTPDRDVESFALLDTYRKIGGNLFDTAEIYGGGQSERALGQYFRGAGGRQDAIIVTKGCVESRWVRPDYIRAAIDRSLERLQMDTIDLYLLHRDDPQVGVDELVEVLFEALQAGKIKSFGGSNWTVDRLAAANAYAKAKGITGFSASSPHLGLATPREPWWAGCSYATLDDLTWYKNVNMPVLAWSSQCRGFFSAKPITDMTYLADLVRVYYSKENLERRERLARLAEQKSVDPSALAVAYVLALPLPVVALVGPTSVPDLERSLGACSISLDSAQVSWLQSGQ